MKSLSRLRAFYRARKKDEDNQRRTDVKLQEERKENEAIWSRKE